MAWTTPHTFNVGDLLTASLMNDIGNNLTYLHANPITGQIPATGNAATAGTGFSYTHTNTSGVYVFTFTSAFAATPTVATDPASLSRLTFTTNTSTTGFTATTTNIAGTATDGAFVFMAFVTV